MLPVPTVSRLSAFAFAMGAVACHKSERSPEKVAPVVAETTASAPKRTVPTLLVKRDDQMSLLGTDEQSAYWYIAGEIDASPLDGSPSRLVVKNDTVYMLFAERTAYGERVDDDDCIVERFPLDGSAKSTVVRLTPPHALVESIFVVGDSMILAEGNSQLRDVQLERLSLAGGKRSTLADHRDSITSIVGDVTNVVWSEADTAGTKIFRAPIAGGPSSKLVEVSEFVGELAMNQGTIYFVHGDQLVHVDAAGGTPTAIPCSQGVVAFAVDASGVYFSSAEELRVVRGDKCLTLAAQKEIRRVILGPHDVVWQTVHDVVKGEIWSERKP